MFISQKVQWIVRDNLPETGIRKFHKMGNPLKKNPAVRKIHPSKEFVKILKKKKEKKTIAEVIKVFLHTLRC